MTKVLELIIHAIKNMLDLTRAREEISDAEYKVIFYFITEQVEPLLSKIAALKWRAHDRKLLQELGPDLADAAARAHGLYHGWPNWETWTVISYTLDHEEHCKQLTAKARDLEPAEFEEYAATYHFGPAEYTTYAASEILINARQEVDWDSVRTALLEISEL